MTFSFAVVHVILFLCKRNYCISLAETLNWMNVNIYREKPHVLISNSLQHCFLAKVSHLGERGGGDWAIGEDCINRFDLPGESHCGEERWDWSVPELGWLLDCGMTIAIDICWCWTRRQSWLLIIITTFLITLFTVNKIHKRHNSGKSKLCPFIITIDNGSIENCIHWAYIVNLIESPLYCCLWRACLPYLHCPCWSSFSSLSLLHYCYCASCYIQY